MKTSRKILWIPDSAVQHSGGSAIIEVPRARHYAIVGGALLVNGLMEGGVDHPAFEPDWSAGRVEWRFD